MARFKAAPKKFKPLTPKKRLVHLSEMLSRAQECPGSAEERLMLRGLIKRAEAATKRAAKKKKQK